MTQAAFDFRKPPPGEVTRHAAGWLRMMCRRAPSNWSRLLPYPTELKPGPVEQRTAAAALATLPEDAIGLPAKTQDAADGNVLLAMGRPLLLALLAGLVGETVTALPEDREFTEVEASLVGYLVRELFLEPMEKGWTEPDPPRLTAGVAGMPSVVWGVPGNEPALTGTLTVSAPFGEHTIHLLVPRSGRWERQSRIEVAAKPVEPAAREQIETLVREMAVDLTVVLGTADLTMLDLATLRAGDVVLLRQKVTQPLEGLVAGVQKFRVWPGTVGGRTAVRIDDAAADTMRYDTGAASSE